MVQDFSDSRGQKPSYEQLMASGMGEFSAALFSGDGLQMAALIDKSKQMVEQAIRDSLSDLPGGHDVDAILAAAREAYYAYDLSFTEFTILYKLGLICLLKVDMKTGHIEGWEKPLRPDDRFIVFTLPDAVLTLKIHGKKALEAQIAANSIMRDMIQRSAAQYAASQAAKYN